MDGLTLLCLFACALFFVWIGFLLAREKPSDYSEEELRQSVRRVAKHYVHVDRPNEEALDVWEEWYEEYFSQVEE